MFPMTFLFLGGRLAVDLLNTVIARDLLGRREDVAAWGAAAGLVSRRELRRGGREPADLRAFREALRRGLVAWAAAGTPPARLIALLNHHLARDPAVTELIRQGDPRRLRKCANPTCRLMFYDTSKSGRRRWCSMQLCGGRAKVRAFYQRRRAVTNRAATPPRAATR